MVSAVLLLLTVSTLAVHGKDISGHLVIPDGCEGETYCDEKGDNYPHEEIDNILMRNLTFLHRMKREAADIDMWEPEPGSTTGNCETVNKTVTPYYLKEDGKIPKVIVQSKFFQQNVTEVYCKKKIASEDCFQGLIHKGSNIIAKCITKSIKIILYIYTTDGQIEAFETSLGADCVCAIMN